ncbi:hypothetical protein [Chitinophaga sp. 212800010-3]|uniref:hypothetical protein n=1 Tax=unclassified Chitinophaga TaxID=2619133 RepID=UPI002DF6B413|nr:hypothetical protein [Chitinophaga sp. 212800010-3]
MNKLTLPNDKYIAWKNPQNNSEDVGIRTNASNDLTMYVLGPDRLYIQSSTGNVGIGTNVPQAKLSVNGDVSAKKIKVTQTGWPDFVFHEAYALPSLQEVENYVAVHNHLPGIPSAKEIETHGVDLGEMNKQLLQKVEELTLYLIREHKKSLELEKENIELAKMISALNSRVDTLEKKVESPFLERLIYQEVKSFSPPDDMPNLKSAVTIMQDLLPHINLPGISNSTATIHHY